MLTRLAETPVEAIVTQFAVELQEIAVLHLGLASERPESLAQAALAVDAMAGLVDAVGERLRPERRAAAPGRRRAAARVRRGERRDQPGRRAASRGRSAVDRVPRDGASRMSQPIEDYALIGDTQTAALVGKNGSIDWLCVPRFDSGAVFAALLGDRNNGRWLIAPAGGLQRVERQLPREHARARDDLPHRRRRRAASPTACRSAGKSVDIVRHGRRESPAGCRCTWT